MVSWNFELASPNILRRNGRAGDEVTVERSLAKDGSKMANVLTVSLADGKS